MAEETIREAIELSGDGFRVDVEKRIIYGVKLLNEHSANGYSYDRDAIREAVPLYEGKPIYAGHDGDRGPLKMVAFVRGPRYVMEKDVAGMRGDVHVGPGEDGDKLLWVADTNPSAVGMSHVISGQVA